MNHVFRKWFCITIAMVLTISPVMARTFYVASQEDFDKIGQEVKSAVEGGETLITITLKKGTYYYGKNHIYLYKQNAPQTSIVIDGKGSTLLPKGTEYRSGDVFEGNFSPECSMIDGRNRCNISYWSDVFHGESRVEEASAKDHLWRIKCTALDEATQEQCRWMYMLLTCWFKSYVLKVDCIKNGYLYFVSEDHSYNESFKCYSLDYDYGYGKQYARFKLCNYAGYDGFRIGTDGRVSLPAGCSKALVGEAGSFLKISSCQLGAVSVTGCRLLGASQMPDQASLIGISNNTMKALKITGNDFNAIHCIVLNVLGTDNVTIDKNTFVDCYKTLVLADNKCRNTRVTRNSVRRCGLRMNQDHCFSVYGENYYIADNTLCDYGYSAIRVGVWHGHTKYNPSCGVIENNEIYCSRDYLEQIDSYGLMDGGAVYVATQNDGCIIRYNYIHDIGGIKDNRGIFCDDGAVNFSIYGNVITHVVNCYCIDAPRSVSVERNVGRANVGNVLYDNIVDGTIRFAGRENDDNGCEYGTNYFLTSGEGAKPATTVKNVSVTGEEVLLESTGERRGRIGVSRTSYNVLKKSPAWKHVKGWFVRKNK